jgi:hypothetical protein
MNLFAAAAAGLWTPVRLFNGDIDDENSAIDRTQVNAAVQTSIWAENSIIILYVKLLFCGLNRTWLKSNISCYKGVKSRVSALTFEYVPHLELVI